VGGDGGLLGLKLRSADDFLREVGLKGCEHFLEDRDGEGVVPIFFTIDCQPGPESMLLAETKLPESVGWAKPLRCAQGGDPGCSCHHCSLAGRCAQRVNVS